MATPLISGGNVSETRAIFTGTSVGNRPPSRGEGKAPPAARNHLSVTNRNRSLAVNAKAAKEWRLKMKGTIHVLTGPTAVGKTELALRWAEANDAEIV